MKTIQLYEEKFGMYLVPRHVHDIWEGRKKLIVKTKEFKEMISRDLYLIDSNYAYGIIRLKKPKTIGLKEFENLRSFHRITELEREEWWKGVETLFGYEFDFKKFETPKRIKAPKGVQIFKKFDFLPESKSIQEPIDLKKLIEDIANAIYLKIKGDLQDTTTSTPGISKLQPKIWAKKRKKKKENSGPLVYLKDVLSIVYENPQNLSNLSLWKDSETGLEKLKPLEDYYVLSEEAISENWIPAKGISALPSKIKKKIPESLHYWLADKESDRIKTRNQLVKLLKNNKITLESGPREISFVLQRHWWEKGTLDSKLEYFDIRFDFPEQKGLMHWVLEDNLIENNTSGLWYPCNTKFWMKIGSKPKLLKSGVPGNPTKVTDAWIHVIDQGTAIFLENKPSLKKISFSGEKLKGLWTFTQRDKEIWSVQKSEPRSK